MFPIAHVSVPAIFCPKLTTPLQPLIGFPWRVGLELLQDRAQRRLAHLEQHMNMIRHHHPRPQVIELAVVKPERSIHQRTDFRVAQIASTPTFVEVSLQFAMPLQIVFHLQQRFPFRAQGDRK